MGEVLSLIIFQKAVILCLIVMGMGGLILATGGGGGRRVGGSPTSLSILGIKDEEHLRYDTPSRGEKVVLSALIYDAWGAQSKLVVKYGEQQKAELILRQYTGRRLYFRSRLDEVQNWHFQVIVFLRSAAAFQDELGHWKAHYEGYPLDVHPFAKGAGQQQDVIVFVDMKGYALSSKAQPHETLPTEDALLASLRLSRVKEWQLNGNQYQRDQIAAQQATYTSYLIELRQDYNLAFGEFVLRRRRGGNVVVKVRNSEKYDTFYVQLRPSQSQQHPLDPTSILQTAVTLAPDNVVENNFGSGDDFELEPSMELGVARKPKPTDTNQIPLFAWFKLMNNRWSLTGKEAAGPAYHCDYNCKEQSVYTRCFDRSGAPMDDPEQPTDADGWYFLGSLAEQSGNLANRPNSPVVDAGPNRSTSHLRTNRGGNLPETSNPLIPPDPKLRKTIRTDNLH